MQTIDQAKAVTQEGPEDTGFHENYSWLRWVNNVVSSFQLCGEQTPSVMLDIM